MEDEVAEALAPHLEEKVEGLVEIDGRYQVKKLERAMVQQKLDRKVAQQLSTEPVPPVNDDPDAVPALVPVSSSAPAAYQEVSQNLTLIPAEIGQNIALNSVHFETGTDRLKPGAYPELNRLLSFLNQHPDLIAEVGAHIGEPHSYAKALELTRVDTLKPTLYAVYT